ncbi:hypothetical protein GLYMA_09G148800v4 [Glycine max]|uniref:Uncharacterized protein n=2 Tax=Glycine subgen. Soja TaxID=1462606 RepID=K7LE06_SOYBN|nr:hypothetical protein GYH30_025094 [Glycine max]KHN23058.1 hypothetical protein glysoja_038883 [Glycine soja]KRH38637.1 hypothetical protein GLYMA_09G148800v4 [Glycine max]RZB92110.1 hypothetical protein D0Y65_024228 [Glycine soja]
MNPNRCSTSLHSDGRSSSSQDSAIQDGSTVSSTRESNGGTAGNVPYQNNGQKVPVTNEHKLQPPSEGEGRNKKKVNFRRGKGIGAVPKTRSSTPDMVPALMQMEEPESTMVIRYCTKYIFG